MKNNNNVNNNTKKDIVKGYVNEIKAVKTFLTSKKISCEQLK